jgi:hypothetical protein
MIIVTGICSLTRNLIHHLHGSTQDHASKQSRWPAAGKQLPPGIAADILTVQDIFDDVEFGLDGWRLRSGTVAFERCEDLASLVVFAFTDEETRAVGEEWAQSPNAEGEEDLECQGESPGDVAWGEGEPKG